MAFTVREGSRMLTLRKICSRCGFICQAKSKYCAFWKLVKEATVQCTWTERCTAILKMIQKLLYFIVVLEWPKNYTVSMTI